MILRKLRQDKRIRQTKNLILFWVLVILVVLVTIFHKNIRVTISDAINNETKVNQWEAIIDGTISNKNNYPKYTHTIYTKAKKEIWIRSSSLNLNDYLDKEVSIIWEYDQKNNDVVDVEAIKLIWEKIIIRWNKHTFLSNWVIFDFDDQNEIKAVQNKDDTISISVSNNIITTFQRFSCRKILKWKSCDELIKEYNNNGKETFDSMQWYTFHKHADKYRLTFDDNYGYIFKDISDENMLNLSNSFQIINNKFVIENKLQEIQDKCKNDQDSATEIIKSDVQYGNSDNIIILLLETETEKWKNAKCNLTFDIWDGRKVTNSIFEVK